MQFAQQLDIGWIRGSLKCQALNNKSDPTDSSTSRSFRGWHFGDTSSRIIGSSCDSALTLVTSHILGKLSLLFLHGIRGKPSGDFPTYPRRKITVTTLELSISLYALQCRDFMAVSILTFLFVFVSLSMLWSRKTMSICSIGWQSSWKKLTSGTVRTPTPSKEWSKYD